MRLSKTYNEFTAEIETVLNYAGNHSLRLGVSNIQINRLAVAHAAWNAEYKLYINPETHTQIQTEKTRELYNETRTLLSGIQQQIKNNQDVALTDTDIKNLYIHKDAQRRSHIPAPTIVPSNILLLSKPLSNRISVLEPASGTNNHLALPPDITRVGRKIALVSVGEPEPEEKNYKDI